MATRLEAFSQLAFAAKALLRFCFVGNHAEVSFTLWRAVWWPLSLRVCLRLDVIGREPSSKSQTMQADVRPLHRDGSCLSSDVLGLLHTRGGICACRALAMRPQIHFTEKQ
jgi:hypothetical protein